MIGNSTWPLLWLLSTGTHHGWQLWLLPCLNADMNLLFILSFRCCTTTSIGGFNGCSGRFNRPVGSMGGCLHGLVRSVGGMLHDDNVDVDLAWLLLCLVRYMGTLGGYHDCFPAQSSMSLQSRSISSTVKLYGQNYSRAAIHSLSLLVKHETPVNFASVGIGGLCGYLIPPISRFLLLSYNIDIKDHRSFLWALGLLWPQQAMIAMGSTDPTWSLQSLLHHIILFVRSLIHQSSWLKFSKVSAYIQTFELWK